MKSPCWLLGLADDNKSSVPAPVADNIAERSGVVYNSSSAFDQKDLTIANQAESIVNLSRSLVKIVNQQEPKGKNKNAKKQ